jgi:hypothetical protein
MPGTDRASGSFEASEAVQTVTSVVLAILVFAVLSGLWAYLWVSQSPLT